MLVSCTSNHTLKALHPNVTAFRSEALWGWVYLKSGKWGPLMGLVTSEEMRKTVLSPGEDKARRRPTISQRALTQNQNYQHFDSGLSDTQNLWEIMSVAAQHPTQSTSVPAARADETTVLLMSSSHLNFSITVHTSSKKMSKM